MSENILCLDDETFPVTSGGRKYFLSPLKMKDQLLVDGLTSDNASEVMETVYTILGNCGLPKDVTESLSIGKCHAVINALMEISEKKS